jgi:hypothetical protein
MEHARTGAGNHAHGDIHLRQAPDYSQEADAVKEEASADAKPRDQQSRGCWTEHACAVEHHRVERDRVGEIVVTHHLDHERLAPGHVERSDGAVEGRQRNHVSDPNGAGPGQCGERERAQHQQDLGRDDQSPPIEAVYHYTGKQADQKDWRELGECHYAEPGSRVGQLQHQPRLRGALHPGAGQRSELAEEIEPIIAMTQRAKRAAALAWIFRGRLELLGRSRLHRGRGVSLRHGAPTCW